jgi:hypothetical protein
MHMVFAGDSLFADAGLHVGLPTLAGTLVGRSLIYALIICAQVRTDSP